jgi:hypothetical protein
MPHVRVCARPNVEGSTTPDCAGVRERSAYFKGTRAGMPPAREPRGTDMRTSKIEPAPTPAPATCLEVASFRARAGVAQAPIAAELDGIIDGATFQCLHAAPVPIAARS